jgi:acyl-CoA synthetase (NDP forming)
MTGSCPRHRVAQCGEGLIVNAAAGSDLSALFAPSSVAVVGASDDTRKFGNWIAVQALRGGRPVHLVNRGKARVLGRETVPDVRSVGSAVDLVVIAVPAAGFESAVDDALAGGARAIVGISGGFGELGAQGREVEARVATKVREAGARLLGPNCLGLLDHTSGLSLTSNELPAGNIGIISQSGNLALELASLLADYDLGISRFTSLGNQADLDAADLIDSYVDHDGTAAIALYCEDFRDGRRIVDVALRAEAAGKPVVLLTVGSTAASSRNARSHTGAIVSSSLVVDAACRASGMEKVASPGQMADLLQAIVRARVPAGNRVAVVADGGGHASVASDLLAAHGLEVAEFSKDLRAMVAGELPSTASVSNPVDVAGGGEQDISCFPRVLRHLLSTDEVEAILFTGYFGGFGAYGEDLGPAELLAAHDMAAMVGQRGRLVVQTMNHRSATAQQLRLDGVPVYRGIDEACWALGRLAVRASRLPRGLPELPAPQPRLNLTGYFDARRLLAGAGVAFPHAAEVVTQRDLLEHAAGMRYPLVLKALADEHKSDRGGVVLAISDTNALVEAWHDLEERLSPPSYSVEEMHDLSDAVELLVGVRCDPRFGPVVLVGLGGTYAEVHRDVQCALGPISSDLATELLLSLRGAALLTGSRGRPPVDIAGAATLVARLSALAAEHPDVSEIECNPLAVSPSGAVALDARIVLDN